MKEVKILGEDKCHIQLIEAVLKHAKLRGIQFPKPYKIPCGGAGGVLTKLRMQLKGSEYLDGEIVLLDHDRSQKEVPEIHKIKNKNKFKWDIYLMILEPNCEGFILKWMGEKFNDPKKRIKELAYERNFHDLNAFVFEILDEVLNQNKSPRQIQELWDFLRRIRKL